jgi:hypothetical protein
MNELIFIYLIAWFLANFEPLQDLIDYLWDKLPSRLTSIKIIDYIYIGLGCQKCLVLYICLITTGDIYMSLLLSFIAYIQEKIIK